MLRLFHMFSSGIASHSSHGDCPDEGMYDIVVGHLTDHPYVYKLHPHGIGDFIGNLIFKLNTMLGFQTPHTSSTAVCAHGHKMDVIASDPNMIFGVFDMRITKWVLMMWLVVLLMTLIFIPLGRKIAKSPLGSRSRWVNLWESLIGFVHDEVVDPNFGGHSTVTAMPYFSTLFFFILFANLLGLIPGMATATGNLAVTAGLAVFTLLSMFIVGTLKQGPQWIITGIVPHGVPAFLFILLWPIEIIGLIIKPFALMVRLFANMTAGHVVIIIFLYLAIMFQSYFVGIGSVTGSLMIYLLELLVAFIQAYIFASLSAIFIGSQMHAH